MEIPNPPARKIAEPEIGNTKQKRLSRAEEKRSTRRVEIRKQPPTFRASHTPMVHVWLGLNARSRFDRF